MLATYPQCYIFDIDGTLTKPRKKITTKFANKFIKWAHGKHVFVATGSDWAKVQEQLPQEVLDVFQGIFCCMGNELRLPNGKVVEKSDFIIPDALNDFLADILNKSEYEPKVGLHMEFRTGMVNFSTLGRKATIGQRNAYYRWDKVHGEREKIADLVNTHFPDLEASVGGSISIDIIEKGKDKGQIVDWMLSRGVNKLTFVGDRCEPGGNDWGIVRELMKTSIDFSWYNINGPNEVLDLLKSLQ